MADNPYVNKVVLGNQTIMDLTQDSVEPSNLLEGETAHSRSGEPITGTAKQGHVIKDQDGTSMTQRTNLKFEGGFNVSDDSQNNTTKVQKDIPITWDEWSQLTEQEAEGKDYYITDEPYVNGKINTEVFTKLWENPNPTSAFAAQTITLASDDYDFLMFEYKISTTDQRCMATIVKKGESVRMNTVAPSSDYPVVLLSRDVNYVSSVSYSVSTASATIGNAYQTNDIFLLPIVIYGFKKNIEFDLTALVANVSTDASKCVYDNTNSELEATNVQDAIDELAGWGVRGKNLGRHTLTANGVLDLTVDLSDVDGGLITLDILVQAPTQGAQYVTLRRTNINTFRITSTVNQDVTFTALIIAK